jgi:hypothetical protein
MESKSVFISSCSRREMARRRPSRTAGRLAGRLELLVGLIVLAAGLVAVIAARGGV